jgi:hypothetical protein
LLGPERIIVEARIEAARAAANRYAQPSREADNPNEDASKGARSGNRTRRSDAERSALGAQAATLIRDGVSQAEAARRLGLERTTLLGLPGVKMAIELVGRECEEQKRQLSCSSAQRDGKRRTSRKDPDEAECR